jgi:hypothetical protein
LLSHKEFSSLLYLNIHRYHGEIQFIPHTFRRYLKSLRLQLLTLLITEEEAQEKQNKARIKLTVLSGLNLSRIRRSPYLIFKRVLHSPLLPMLFEYILVHQAMKVPCTIRRISLRHELRRSYTDAHVVIEVPEEAHGLVLGIPVSRPAIRSS